MIIREKSKYKPIRVQVPSLGKIVKDHKIAEGLARWDEFAVHNLWANKPLTEEDLKQWIKQFNKWIYDVKNWMEKVGCLYLDVKQFFVLGLVTEYQFDDDSEFNHKLNMLNMHRERIKNLINIWTGVNYL